MTKLHLGAGRRVLKGFISIDIEESPTTDIVADIAKLDMFSDGEVDSIYCSHAFEYFDRVQAPDVLREWHRVLKPGGDVRISVPDFEKLIDVYRLSGSLSSIVGPLFGRWENPISNLTIFHKTVWDLVSLRALMTEVGFGKVKAFDPVNFLKSVDPEYDDYSLAFFPHMDRSGIQISLCLAASKGL
jgi:ubiquinone/menaquinone biosynthesis C-methylase UbiE